MEFAKRPAAKVFTLDTYTYTYIYIYHLWNFFLHMYSYIYFMTFMALALLLPYFAPRCFALHIRLNISIAKYLLICVIKKLTVNNDYRINYIHMYIT